jgi:hypothetical protein
MPNSSGVVGARRLRAAAVLAVAGVMLAACGGGSKTLSVNVTSPNPPVQTSAATTPSAPASVPPTSVPPTTSTPATDTGASFCKYAKTEKSQVADEVKAFEADSPAQLAAFEQRALSAVTALAASAPASVRSAVKTVVTADQAFFNQLKAAHFDYAKLNPSDVEKINTPAFVRATHTIVNYFQTKCV